MKIDLHIHTKKTFEDTFNRDIEPNKFIEKMKESNVGIVGITNHNTFYEDQFNKIQNCAKGENILVLPGVELTVFIKDKNKIKHINLIFNNDNGSISKLTEFLQKRKIDSKNPVNIYDVIKFFDDEEKKVIFYPDKKSHVKERGFSDEEIKEIFLKNSRFKNVCVLDTNIKSYNHYFRNNVSSLIGSDVKDWNNYLEESRKLINYYSPIPTFESLYEIFKNGDTYENFRKDNLIKYIYDVKLDSDEHILNNVQIIEKSVNIIFGSKATGKTTLLKSLYDKLEVDKNKKIFYDSKDIDNQDLTSIAKSAPEYEKCREEFKKIEDDICSTLREIISYKEELNSNYVNDFYSYYNNLERNKGKFSIISAYVNCVVEQYKEKNTIKNIIRNLKQIISTIYSKNEDLHKETTNIVNELINKWKEEYLRINLEYYENGFIKKTIDNLTKIIKINKDVSPKINSFGLYETFINRLTLNNKISKLKELILNTNVKGDQSSKLEINLIEFKFKHEYEVPIENSNDKVVWIINGYKKLNIRKSGNGRNNLLKEILKYLIQRKSNDFTSIKDKINNENLESLNELLNDKKSGVFVEEYKFLLKNSNYINREPSPGEKSYIFLKNKLNKEGVDWFFIDEPEEHLNSQFISEFLLFDIEQLIKKGKTIIITTHNNILGINTKPSNYILRENIEEKGVFKTWYGNMASKSMTPLFDNVEEKKIDITNILLKYFEGNENLYIYRSDVYDIEKDKNEK